MYSMYISRVSSGSVRHNFLSPVFFEFFLLTAVSRTFFNWVEIWLVYILALYNDSCTTFCPRFIILAVSVIARSYFLNLSIPGQDHTRIGPLSLLGRLNYSYRTGIEETSRPLVNTVPSSAPLSHDISPKLFDFAPPMEAVTIFEDKHARSFV